MQQVGYQAVIVGLNAFLAGANQMNAAVNRLNSQLQVAAVQGGRNWGDFGNAADRALTGVVTAIGLATTAVSTLATVSGTLAATFESSLVKVQVLSTATAEDMERLSGAIYDIGRSSTIGMNQVAEGAIEIAKAGFTAQDQIDGMLESVVAFTTASAGEVGMAEAAITVAKGLTVWGLKGSDAARVTNALTAAAQGSVLSYKDLTRSFQQAANVSALMGLTIEDVAATMAVMGQAGLRGSDAGTSLKQMFIELLTPSKDAAEAMREYNISLFDTEGKVRPFRDVIASIQDAFGESAIANKKLTEATRAQALATIFGSDAIRASIVSAKFGVEAFDKFKDSIENTKTTDIANLFMKPTSAQLDILKNKLLAAAGVFGNEFLEGARQNIIVVNLFADSISRQDIQNFAGVLINIAASSIVVARNVYDAASAFVSMTAEILNTNTALGILGVSLALIAAPFVITGLAAISGGFVTLFVAIGSIATSGYITLLILQSGGLIAALQAVSVAAGGVSLAFAGMLLPIGALITNFGGVRDTLIRIIAVGIDVYFYALTAGAYLTATAIIELAQALTYIGLGGEVARKELDKVQAKLDDLATEANNSRSKIYDFANSLITNENIVESFSRKIQELTADFLALGKATTFNTGLFTGGLEGDVTFAPKNIYENVAADQARKTKEEIDKLIASLGKSTAGFDHMKDSAGKAKTFLEELGVSVDQVRKFLLALNFTMGDTASFMTRLGISAAEASPLIGDFGLTVDQGIAVLVKLGYTAEEAASRVNALYNTIEADKAMEKAKKDAEEAERAYQSWLQKIEEVNASIRDKLTASVNAFFNAVTSGSSAAQIFNSISAAIALLEARIARVQALGGSTAGLSTVAGIVSTVGNNIAGRANAAPKQGESASNAASGFLTAANAMEVLVSNGQDASKVLQAMEANLDTLSVQFHSLSEQDMVIAGAIMEAYKEVIAQLVRGLDPKLALETIRIFEDEFTRLASASDKARTDAFQKEEDRRKSIEQEALAERIVIAKSAADTWLAIEQMKTDKYNEEVRKRAQTDKNKADAEINQLKMIQEQDRRLAEARRAERNRANLEKFGFALADSQAGVAGAPGSDLLFYLGQQAGKTLLEIADIFEKMGFTIPEELQRKITAMRLVGSFASGGIVPGYPGQPQMAMVHGAERIIPSGVLAAESTISNHLLGQILSAVKDNGNTSYVVNANYTKQQSPANIGMDLRAMVASTR